MLMNTTTTYFVLQENLATWARAAQIFIFKGTPRTRPQTRNFSKELSYWKALPRTKPQTRKFSKQFPYWKTLPQTRGVKPVLYVRKNHRAPTTIPQCAVRSRVWSEFPNLKFYWAPPIGTHQLFLRFAEGLVQILRNLIIEIGRKTGDEGLAWFVWADVLISVYHVKPFKSE